MRSLFLQFFIVGFILTIESFAQQFRMIRPVPNNIQTNGSYLFGEPNFQNPSLAHHGIDISISYDTVRSASDGVVYLVGYNPNDIIGGYEPGGAGNYVIIKSTWNNKDIFLNYFHLTKPLVGSGQTVVTNQPIAISGNTGNSIGPHLHFEIRQGTQTPSASRTRRNPELWVAISGMGAIYGFIPNAANSTRVDISPDPKPRPPYTTFAYALTYNFNDPAIQSDDVYNENYAIGDVEPGTYTITALNGAYRRVVTVSAGQVVNADAALDVIESEMIINEFILYQNYPNPFNPNTTISYYLDMDGYVNLSIYNLIGELICNPVAEKQNRGFYRINFDGSALSSGNYIYRLTENNKVISKLMTLIK
ncbi:MAG: peptidoglycan DD-metalloendopeptidase family protein [Ignavibacteriaceae bacterium]|nr:peptidoglycan DD-metalloendopeptidase family protein [Ignavibacteriaceae bacterium]